MAGGRPPTSGLNPSDLKFQCPARFALVDEVNQGRVDHTKLKRLSGDAPITARDLHERERTRRATATILLAANIGEVPRLGLHDPAMADRFREIPYPSVPATHRRAAGNDTYKQRMQTDPEVGAAMLARLVQECIQQSDATEPPQPPDSVKRASAARAQADAGDLGDFALRLEASDAPYDRLAVQEAWAAFAEFVGGRQDDREVAGIKRAWFARRLAERVPGLPQPKPTKIHGRTLQAWHGWRLRDDDVTTSEEELRLGDPTMAT